jgi:hypothetical protein
MIDVIHLELTTPTLVRIGTDHVQYIQCFKYHILSQDTCDDAYIHREVLNFFFRTYVLIRLWRCEDYRSWGHLTGARDRGDEGL